MSNKALDSHAGEILERLVPDLAHQLDSDPETIRRAAQEAYRGKVLEGNEVYVFYADVLGFKAQLEADARDLEARLETALTRLNFELLARLPSKAVAPIHPAYDNESVVGLTKLNPAAIFSDSIFVVSKDNSDESKRQIAHMANNAFLTFFGESLPLRGAIAKGAVWWNRNTDVRLGPGITKAYEFAESLDCVGILLCDDFTPPENSSAPVVVRMKGNEARTANLRVPLQLGRNGIAGSLRGDLIELFDAFAARPGNGKDPEIRARYTNSRAIVVALGGNPVFA